MAKPRVFVSSTYYDLKHLRSSLENFIESLGYEPILSEKGNISYSHDRPLDESCYREVENSDIFVLIIGGRYGSESSRGNKKNSYDLNTRYDSITKEEFKTAIKKEIPTYILIEKSVYSDFETYLKNKENISIEYAHVDSTNIFILIEEILALPHNNPINKFDRYSEIELWLKEQWAGKFRELLNAFSQQKQLFTISNHVSDLSEISESMRRYLEQIVTKVIPEKSEEIIKEEKHRIMRPKQDAGNLLLFFYDELINKEKHIIDTKDVVDNINWSGSRINTAFNYLKDNGWIKIGQTGIGNIKGVPIFRVTGLSSQGIGEIEDNRKFKDTFGVEVNFSILKLSLCKEI